MIPLRTVRATVRERITGIPLAEPISVSLTLDEEWSPRIQGEVTLPANTDLAPMWLPNLLWKFQGDVLTLDLETRYGPGFPIKTLTEAYGGSIAAVTAAHGGSVEAVSRAHSYPWHPGEAIEPLSKATELWGGSVAAVTADHGGSIAAITRRLRVPGGSYLIPDTERETYRIRIRNRTPAVIEGVLVLQVAGEDVRLHDYRHTETTVLLSTHTRLRELVHDVLTRIAALAGTLHTVELVLGADVPIQSGQEWQPGQTAWEFLHPILESVGWTLYTDADGRYRLEARITTPAPHDLDSTRNLIDYRPSTDLKDQFYSGAIVEYTDAEPEDIPGRYDVYVMPGATRIMHETRPGVRTIPGAAEQLVNRSSTRAATATATATLALPLKPGNRLGSRTPTQQEYGTISAITHDFPTAETRIKLRDIAT